MKTKFENKGYKGEILTLNEYVDIKTEEAGILVIKKGVDCLLEGTNANGMDLYEELSKLDWDKKGQMYGKVVNKHARYNLSFHD